jgi:hypothetical protein
MTPVRISAILFSGLLIAGCAGLSSPHRAAPGDAGNALRAGIKPDGKTLNTAAIQRAIDELSASGGGTLAFPAGTYLTGMVRLKDNITLQLDAGAVLLGSPELKDYPETKVPFPTMNDAFYRHNLLYAEGVRNIAITGQGRIDGQGGADGFKRRSTKAPERYMNRPSLIRFVNCTGVRLRDVRIENAGFWVTHFLACDDVVIDGVNVESRTANYNNDGFDIDCCSNVRIANCYVNSQDDAICLKSTGNRVCRNVTITNCVLSSNCSGIRFGCECFGGFEDIVISNVTIQDVGASAIQLQVFDGGIMDRVTLSGITMRNVAQGIFVNVGHELYPIGIADADLPIKHGDTMGRVRNIILRDIQADGVGRCQGRSVGGEEVLIERKLACIISGMPESHIENITLQNIRMRFVGKGTAEDAASDLADVKNGFNAGSMGMTPAYAFYCRNVDNLRMRDVDVSCENDDVRPALFMERCANVDLSGLHGVAHPSARAFLRMRNVTDVFLHGNRPLGVEAFLALEGEKTKGVSLCGNDLRAAACPVVIAPDVPAGALLVDQQHREGNLR